MKFLRPLLRLGSGSAIFGLALVALLLVGPTPASAAIIYNNFGPGDSYNTIAGHIIGPDGFGNDWVVAEQFTALNTGLVGDLTIALGNISGADTVHVVLAVDAGGLPGAILASYDFSGLPAFGAGGPPVTDTPDSNVFLFAGTNYWLVASSTGLNAWNFNSTGDVGLHGVSFDGGGSFLTFDDTHGAFRLELVPEPTSITLWAGALGLGMVGYRLRRRAA